MNELDTLERLLDSLIDELDHVLASGEQLTDEFQGELAQELGWLFNRIQELKQNEPVEGLPPNVPSNIPEMQQAMPSSNIFGFNYDYENNRLLVKFQGNDGVGQGPVYAYEGVEPYIFNLFRQGAAIAKTTGQNKWGKWWQGKTPSIGAAMNAFIKIGGYPYQRLS